MEDTAVDKNNKNERRKRKEVDTQQLEGRRATGKYGRTTGRGNYLKVRRKSKTEQGGGGKSLLLRGAKFREDPLLKVREPNDKDAKG